MSGASSPSEFVEWAWSAQRSQTPGASNGDIHARPYSVREPRSRVFHKVESSGNRY